MSTGRPQLKGVGKNWTPAQVRYLRDNYGLRSDQAIARTLGRSIVAIRLKALKIGINRTTNFFTASDVRRIFQVDVNKVLHDWIAKGYLTASRSHVGVGPRKVWCVLGKDIAAFLMEHPDKYNYKLIDPIDHPVWRALAERVANATSIKPSIKRTNWTAEEDAFLLNHNNHMTYDELAAKLPGRTSEAVHYRLEVLREKGHLVPLKKNWRTRKARGKVAPKRPWTKTEIQYLLQHWYASLGDVSDLRPNERRARRRALENQVAKHLKRSKLACLTKAVELKESQRGRRQDLENANKKQREVAA